MKGRTLAEIRELRGADPHGFVLMVTGALPSDPVAARQLGAAISEAVDEALTKLAEAWPSGEVEIMAQGLRVENFAVYMEKGLPNAS